MVTQDKQHSPHDQVGTRAHNPTPLSPHEVICQGSMYMHPVLREVVHGMH